MRTLLSHRFYLVALAAVFTAAATTGMAGTTFVVNSTADSGGTCPGANCTLRQALASAASQGDEITFDLPSGSVITLTSSELFISGNITITGPGKSLLSVQRSSASGTPAFRIFNISSRGAARISRLTISGGRLTDDNTGGAGVANGDYLFLSDAAVTGNSIAGYGNGGGISNRTGATAYLQHCVVSNNSTAPSSVSSGGNGGGISNENSGSLTVYDTVIAGNSAPGGMGGGIFQAGNLLSVTATTFDGNTSSTYGGAVEVNSSTNAGIKDCTFTNNSCGSGGGGAVDNNQAALYLENCAFSGNASHYVGGAVANTSTGGVTLSKSTLQNNSAVYYGGAVFNGVIASSNSAQFGNVYIDHCMISDNTAVAAGAGVANLGGQVSFDDSSVLRNTVTASTPQSLPIPIKEMRGGGLYNDNGQCWIRTSNFSGNACATTTYVPGPVSGGGLSSSGTYATVEITDSTIANNSLNGFATFNLNGSAAGGGIVAGKLTLLRSTVAGNVANGADAGSDGTPACDASGGGIYMSAATIVNSTVVANSARGGSLLSPSSTTVAGAASGGGVYCGSGVSISNSTVTANAALGGRGSTLSNTGFGGGIFELDSYSSSVKGAQLKSSIVAGNTASGKGADVYGNYPSQGFNLIGKTDGATGFPAATDKTGTVASPLDPKLDPKGLQDNGGLTQTIALIADSPAIDAGNRMSVDGELYTDQRGTGFARTFDDPNATNTGDATDIGAFESQSAIALPPALGNISTRLAVQTGDNVLIGGFIVTGTQPKKVLVRALGPSLPVAGALADPKLDLYTGSTLLQSNDNWPDSPDKQAIIDSTIPPPSDSEAAIVATLPANNASYTAVVSGANGGVGVGQVEIYDLDRAADARLANISTRGFVQSGDDVMIGGVIVLGLEPENVLVRAIGPSLSVVGALADPTLELRDKNGALLQSNDNWQTDQRSEIEATTIPPANELESALLRTLSPGNYTAIVRGANGSTGVALVEVYGL